MAELDGPDTWAELGEDEKHGEKVKNEYRALARAAIAIVAELCARIVEHPNAGLVPPDGGDPSPSEMFANCAADIRALIPGGAL